MRYQYLAFFSQWNQATLPDGRRGLVWRPERDHHLNRYSANRSINHRLLGERNRLLGEKEGDNKYQALGIRRCRLLLIKQADVSPWNVLGADFKRLFFSSKSQPTW